MTPDELAGDGRGGHPGGRECRVAGAGGGEAASGGQGMTPDELAAAMAQADSLAAAGRLQVRVATDAAARAELERLNARVAELEAERDRLRGEAAGAAALRAAFNRAAETYPQNVGPMSDAARAVWATLYVAVRDTSAGLALLARVAELEAALRPFAGEYRVPEGWIADDTPLGLSPGLRGVTSDLPTVGDCRRAAVLLAGKGGGA